VGLMGLDLVSIMPGTSPLRRRAAKALVLPLLGLAIATGPTMAAPASAAVTGASLAGLSSKKTQYAQQAYYRGSYQLYYDCDLTGFTGVYYGWWQGYWCHFNTSTRYWDLYA
jgi:hypothetical protein